MSTIVRSNFASIVEAVAHYVNRGYSTVSTNECSRIMRRGRDEVIINKEDFMLVSAEELIA